MNTPNTLACIGLLAMSTFTHLLPRFTRPDLFFGVTVDPAFRITDAARRILRNYRIALWCSTIAAGLCILVLNRSLIALIVYIIGVCGAQVASHRNALIHATTPSTAVEIDLSAPEEHFPGGLLVALLPFVVLIVLGLWAVPHIDRLPGRLPVHWAFNGADRWVVTSPRAIIGLLVQYGIICLVLTALALGLLHWSRRVSAWGSSGEAERQFRRRNLLLILTAEYLTILPPLFALMQAPALAMKIWSLMLPGTVLAFVLSLMRAGQGGSRSATGRGEPVGDRTADARWIGGLIYFNRTDPALLVEKRMGIGWTLNFGNPWSWILLVAVVATAPILRHALR